MAVFPFFQPIGIFLIFKKYLSRLKITGIATPAPQNPDTVISTPRVDLGLVLWPPEFGWWLKKQDRAFKEFGLR